MPKNDEQAILDLGCGIGTLTIKLGDYCNKIVGVDSSKSIIDKAPKQFSNFEFKVCDALALSFEYEIENSCMGIID